MNTQLLNTSYDRLFTGGLRQLAGAQGDAQSQTAANRAAQQPIASAIERGYAALGEGRTPGAFSAELVIFRVGQSIGAEGAAAGRLDALSAGLRGEVTATNSIPTPDKVAGTILGFVEKRLAMAKAEGADDAKLESMLQQAKAGVDKGYEQAREELQARGFLPDTSGQLESDIDSGYAAVAKGLERLGETIGGNSRVVQQQPVGAIEQSASLRSERSEISLKTRDGDTVKLSLSAVAAVSAELIDSADGGRESLKGLAGSRFMLDVEGDLDDGELAAITSFLQQIDSLANDFFAGDMQKAVDKAMELDVDMGEIANFAVNLTSVSYSEVNQAYAMPNGNSLPGTASETALQNQFSPMARFIDDLRTSMAAVGELLDRPSTIELIENSVGALFDVGLVSQPAQSVDGALKGPERLDLFIEFMRASTERMTTATG